MGPQDDICSTGGGTVANLRAVWSQLGGHQDDTWGTWGTVANLRAVRSLLGGPQDDMCVGRFSTK